MKANEFVKKFGWDETKEIVCNFNYNSSNKFITSLKDNSAIHIDDLKQLIEAKELVEFGIPDLKKSMFSKSKSIEDVKNWILSVSDSLLTEKGIELKKAIQLVESVDE